MFGGGIDDSDVTAEQEESVATTTTGAPMPEMALPSGGGAPPAAGGDSAILFGSGTEDAKPVDFEEEQAAQSAKGKDKKKKKKGKEKKGDFTDKAASAAANLLFGGDDDDDGEGEGEGAEEGEGAPKRKKRKWYHFWRPSFYQPYFDVDTKDVFARCLAGLMPIGKPFFERVEGNPDLYGTFWVTTTILFLLGISSNFAEYIAYWWAGAGEHWNYNFYKISIAAAVFYAFVGLMPLIVWALQRFVVKAKLRVVQIYCVYGYSLTSFLIATPFCIAPVEWVRWLVIMLACAVSCATLIVAFYKAFKHDIARGTLVIIVAVVFHVALALTYKCYFFSKIVVPSYASSGASQQA